tara:strand:+ start:1704 stop:2090 length:387 start_codon:yes stop_codon:yes gene_type:complete
MTTLYKYRNYTIGIDSDFTTIEYRLKDSIRVCRGFFEIASRNCSRTFLDMQRLTCFVTTLKRDLNDKNFDIEEYGLCYEIAKGYGHGVLVFKDIDEAFEAADILLGFSKHWFARTGKYPLQGINISSL